MYWYIYNINIITCRIIYSTVYNVEGLEMNDFENVIWVDFELGLVDYSLENDYWEQFEKENEE